MSRRKIKAGSTSQTVPVFVQDTSSTVGAGLGSLVFNTSGLAAKYRREGQSSWTTITLATATVGTWTSGGFVSDGGPVTGGYEFGVPDAALAAGAKWAEIAIYGATNMLAVLIEIELDTIDYQAAGGKVPATVAAGDVAGNLPSAVNAMAAGVITATAIAADAITAAKIADGAIDSATFAAGTTIPRCTLVDTTSANTDMITAAAIRAAVGLATNNLDGQLQAIAGYIDTEVSTLVTSVGGGLNALVTAVKARTDLIPAGGFPANFSALAVSGAGIVNADAKAINGTTIIGDGSSGSKFRV